MSNGTAQKSPPQEFELVDDKEKIILLSDAARGLSSALIWTRNQEVSFNSHLKLFHQAKRFLLIPIPGLTALEDFVSGLKNHKTTETFFCVSHHRANLFFSAQFKGLEKEDLVFTVPKELHKVQRRSNLRFGIPPGRILKIQFQDPLFPENTLTQKVFDLSAGGLSFIAKEADAAMYTTGLILHELTFTIRAKKFTVSAEVRYNKLLPNNSSEDGHKIGVAFQGLSKGDEKLIRQYVNEESRRIYMALL